MLRGLVVILMTLDHTRDLMHISSITQSPTDLATTTAAIFFTRWITHLCAPTFVFLSGISAYISLKNKNSITETRQFLLSRGIWLIVLDLTIVNFGVWFDVHFNVFLFDVLSAIGFGFILLSFLLKKSVKTIAIIGLAIIFLHGLVPLLPLSDPSVLKKILLPFFAPAAFPLGSGATFVMGYPPIPWLGIMLTGFGAGKLFELPQVNRKKILFKTGLASIGLFILVRALNIYGDPAPWTRQNTDLYTFLSFINVTKYPPSLSFCLITLGIILLIFSFLEGRQNIFTNIASVYGKVPLFYFLVHWYVIHPLMFLMIYLQGFKYSDLLFGFNFGRPKDGSGVELWLIYLIWAGVLIALFPLCKWYGNYKENHKEKKWLRFL